MLLRLWRSGTITTWASFLSRSVGTLLLLAIVLRKFTPADFNLWALFSIFLSLQTVADFGFGFTFVRALSAALAGANAPRMLLRGREDLGATPPNGMMVARIIGTMRAIYRRLALIYLAVLVSVGTYLMIRPISQSDSSGWISWGIIMISGYVTLRSNYLIMLMQGLNEVALLRRWEAITSVAGTVVGCVALLLNGSLMILVISTQFWVVFAALRNFHICRKLLRDRFGLTGIPLARTDGEMVKTLWPSAWRTAIGAIMSLGLIQATGIFYAQIADPVVTASYLLCLRILQMLSAFSQAPFYSKLPLLTQWQAKGMREQLLALAAKGMRLSLWVYVGGFLTVGIICPLAIRFLESPMEFPSLRLWSILGLMFFIERYGAMHLNLYSTTGHIINHIVNGVTGILSFLYMIFLFPVLGIFTVPVGLLLGYISFYMWYPSKYTYKEYNLRFSVFDRKVAFFPLLAMGLSLTLLWLLIGCDSSGVYKY